MTDTTPPPTLPDNEAPVIDPPTEIDLLDEIDAQLSGAKRPGRAFTLERNDMAELVERCRRAESRSAPFGAGHPRTTARVETPRDGFMNEAGEITNLVHGGIGGSLGIIRTRAGAFRASHYHLKDSHLLHVLEGEVRYYERAIGSKEIEIEEVFGPDDTFATPPMREHLMIFDAPTVMVSASSRSRTHEEHEADVVRVPRESWGV